MDPVFYRKEWLLPVLDFVERHLFANCDLYGFIEFVKWDRSTSAYSFKIVAGIELNLDIYFTGALSFSFQIFFLVNNSKLELCMNIN